MKKWERFFDILSGTGVGLFLGKLLYLLWHTRAYPELYAMQSAPWYVALLVPGAGMVLALLIAGIGKAVLRRRAKRTNQKKQ